jgi:N-acetylglutamate synthase-like GNAT family acetyltransferase
MSEETLKIAGQRPATFTILHEFPCGDLEKAWRDCLARVELPAHYNAPEFFLSPLWDGKRPFAILAQNGTKVVGIVTGIHEGKELNCGKISRPQICIDKTAESAAVEAALLEGLLAEADHESLLNVYSWTLLDWFPRFGFRHRLLEGDVALDLANGPDALFKQFHENRRRNIRAAVKNGVEVSQTSKREDLLEYYEVYVKWRQTERKKIVGIILRFYPGGLLEFSSASCLDEFLNLRPNDLLHWRAIEWACAEGFQRYSLGGAHPFLRRFGGTVVPIHRYRIDRTWVRRHDLREAVLEFGRRSLRRMPAPVEETVRRLVGKGEARGG